MFSLLTIECVLLLSYYRSLDAIDQKDEDRLTALGYHLAALPVDVRIGKMLIRPPTLPTKLKHPNYPLNYANYLLY